MSVFQRLWSYSGEKEKQPKQALVEEVDPEQTYNPYNQLLLLKFHTDIVRILLQVDDVRCVSAADDNKAAVWNIQLGYKLAVLIGHSRPITSMVLLPAKGDHTLQLLTGSSDKQLKTWDLVSGDCLLTITEHSASVKSLLLIDNGSGFCSGGQGLCVWNRWGRLIDSFHPEGEESDIGFMILLRNDRVVAAVDKQLVVYSIASENVGKAENRKISLIKKLPPHREVVRSLINVTEDSFASGSIDGTIILWKTETLLPHRYFNSVTDYQGENKTYPYSIQHMICVHERYIISAIGVGFGIFDTMTGKLLTSKHYAHFSKICHLSFTCGGLFLVTSSEDGAIRLWGNKSLLETVTQLDKEPKVPDETIFRFLGHVPDSNKQEIYFQEPALLGECLGHSGAVQVLQDFDSEGLVSCGADGMLIVWKNANIELMRRSKLAQHQAICTDGIV